MVPDVYQMICLPKSVMVAALLLLLISITGAQIYNQREAGCGNKFEVLQLNCQNIGNQVTLIQVTTITVTYKADCPFTPGIDDCYHVVQSTNSFYQEVIAECQNKESCYFVSRQIPIPLCNTVIHFGNFVEVTYDCIPNGVTVPTTSTTTPVTTPTTTLPASSTQPLSTVYPVSGGVTSTTVSSNNVTLGAGGADRIGQTELDDSTSSNTGTITAVAVVLSIILILVILIVITTVFYRRRKLPYKIQTGLRDGLDAVGGKFRPVVAAAGRLKGRLGTNHTDSASDKSSKVGVPPVGEEEDIYASIDELKSPQYSSTYQDWSAEGKTNDGFSGEVEGELPAILVISGHNTIRRNNITSITVPEEELEPTDYEDDLDDDEDGWGDSEFDDDDSGDEYTQNSRPRQSSVRRKAKKSSAPKPNIAPKPSVSSVINAPQGLSDIIATSGANSTSHDTNPTGYQHLQNSNGGQVIDEEYYSIAAAADEDYYTTAADAYDEAQPVNYTSHC